MVYGLRHKPEVLSAKRPRFSNVKGATWDTVRVILPNGKEINGHLDTSWGMYVYFPYKGKWKKIDAMTIEDRGQVIKLKNWWKPKN